MLLLDTDHLSLLQVRDTPAAFALQARLEALSPDEVVTTVITMEEQMRGWLALIHRVTDAQRQVAYYERLLGLVAIFAEWEVLPFDQRAAVNPSPLRGHNNSEGWTAFLCEPLGRIKIREGIFALAPWEGSPWSFPGPPAGGHALACVGSRLGEHAILL